ncbi:hypothetical protein [Ornithinimicrobium ciconiae]|uniref:hypothetical protein n=1 Tax=Ornithinimicrobium ciconiae TaxID=2594265 RepID=UPI0013FD07E5|nr:hypothetical protein [Ornithinimicrobium ciconiae]
MLLSCSAALITQVLHQTLQAVRDGPQAVGDRSCESLLRTAVEEVSGAVAAGGER